MPEAQYDVFLSFSGADRKTGSRLAAELRVLGLRVFIDEDIERFSGITERIRTALALSKTLVAYYSADYATRAACQHELRMAFLAGQQKHDPCERIMVVNPEPGTDHLRPIQLADAKFAIPDNDVAGQIAKRSASFDSPIGALLPVSPPSWPAHRIGHVQKFVGRNRELWDLHSALHASGFPLIDEDACGSTAAVSGLPGAGKTALVTTYAWRFAAAFPGGIRWVSLQGVAPRPDALRRRYESAGLRVVPATGGNARARERAASGRRGRTEPRASLWVVDDVPSDAGPELLRSLPQPEDSAVRTILISQDDVFHGELPMIHVGPLPEEDAAALLDGYRLPDDHSDHVARQALARRLGHNAAALVTVGDHLRDRHGLFSYRTFAADLDATGSVADAIFAPAVGVLDRMTPDELIIVSLADRLKTTTFSAAKLVDLNYLAPFDVGATMKKLRDRSAATRNGTSWHLDPYVVHAVGGVPSACPGPDAE